MKECAPQSLRNFELNTSPGAPTVADVVCGPARQMRRIHSSNIKPVTRKRGAHSSDTFHVEATYKDRNLTTVLSVDREDNVRAR